VSPIPGKGHGLVVTEAVKAGTLLLVSKATVRTCIDPDSAEGRRVGKLLSMDYDTRLVEKTSYYLHHIEAMHTVKRNPQLTKEFYSLWAGDDWSREEEALGRIPPGAVDAWRVERTVSFNSFRTNEIKAAIDLPNSGFWLLPSAMNHACQRELGWIGVGFVGSAVECVDGM